MDVFSSFSPEPSSGLLTSNLLNSLRLPVCIFLVFPALNLEFIDFMANEEKIFCCAIGRVCCLSTKNKFCPQNEKLHFSPVSHSTSSFCRAQKCATADVCEYDPRAMLSRHKRDVDPLINEIKKIIYRLRVLRLFPPLFISIP